jgi:hypothetical protein
LNQSLWSWCGAHAPDPKRFKSGRRFHLALNLINDFHHVNRLFSGELRAALQTCGDASMHGLRLVHKSMLVGVAPLPARICSATTTRDSQQNKHTHTRKMKEKDKKKTKKESNRQDR